MVADTPQTPFPFASEYVGLELIGGVNTTETPPLLLIGLLLQSSSITDSEMEPPGCTVTDVGELALAVSGAQGPLARGASGLPAPLLPVPTVRIFTFCTAPLLNWIPSGLVVSPAANWLG